LVPPFLEGFIPVFDDILLFCVGFPLFKALLLFSEGIFLIPLLLEDCLLVGCDCNDTEKYDVYKSVTGLNKTIFYRT
jgi:hypothetical protein